jgi:FLVCR family feline leukemia virus subgroup C receptor-related protein
MHSPSLNSEEPHISIANKSADGYSFKKPGIIITDENSVVQNEYNFSEPEQLINSPNIRNKITNDQNDESSLTHIYFRRWLILLIFSFISLLSAFNWIEYNIIQDVTIKFYNRSLPVGEVEQNSAVNWFSMVYMLCYTPLVFPAMFLLEKKGLKLSILLGGLLTTIGSIIKCFAAKPEYFYLAILGQTICAIAQAFTLAVPARLSGLWFGPEQVALATSIGVFGNQLGVAAGFLIPPMIVIKSDDMDEMQRRFLYLLVPIATLAGLATLAGFFRKYF